MATQRGDEQIQAEPGGARSARRSAHSQVEELHIEFHETLDNLRRRFASFVSVIAT
jgi:hypothetical protein